MGNEWKKNNTNSFRKAEKCYSADPNDPQGLIVSFLHEQQ